MFFLLYSGRVQLCRWWCDRHQDCTLQETIRSSKHRANNTLISIVFKRYISIVFEQLILVFNRSELHTVILLCLIATSTKQNTGLNSGKHYWHVGWCFCEVLRGNWASQFLSGGYRWTKIQLPTVDSLYLFSFDFRVRNCKPCCPTRQYTLPCRTTISYASFVALLAPVIEGLAHWFDFCITKYLTV